MQEIQIFIARAAHGAGKESTSSVLIACNQVTLRQSVPLTRSVKNVRNRTIRCCIRSSKRDGATKTTGREAKTRSLSTEPNGSSESHSSHLSSPNPGSQSSARF